MVVAFGRPKSFSKVVAIIMNSARGVSQNDIIVATGLSERSVKYSLKHLENSGVIRSLCLLGDLRRKIYAPEATKK